MTQMAEETNALYRRGRFSLSAKQKTLLAYFILAGVILFDLLFLKKFGQAFLDSDMASEMILANMLNQSGSFLSTEWFYSTELRVLSTTQIYRIGLWLFPNNWHDARMLGQLLALVLVAGSMVYCMRGARFSRASSVLCASALCAPITYWSINLIAFGGYYACFFSTIAFSVGLTLRLIHSGGRKAAARWMCLCVLSFLSGLNGVRLMMVYIVPLFAAAAALFFIAAGEKTVVPQRQAEFRYEKRFLVIAGICLSLSLVGYFINSKVLAAQYQFQSFGNLLIGNFSFTALLNALSDLLVLFGYQQTIFGIEDRLLSLTGTGSFLGLFTGGAVFFFFFLCLRKWRVLSFAQRMIVASFAASTLVCGLVFAVSPNNERYWIPVLPMAFAVLTLGVTVCDFPWLHARKALCGLLAVCMLCSSYSASYQYVHSPSWGNEKRVDAAYWLAANGYQQGYATFWDGNVLTELSDGQLELWVINDVDQDKPVTYRWLQKIAHDNRFPNSERLFLICSAREHLLKSSFVYRYYTDVKEDYCDTAFKIYTFANPHLLPEMETAKEASGAA